MRFRTWVALVATLLLVGVGLTVAGLRPHERTVTVMFSRTTSLYQGAAVKVLGVKVGKVTSIKVQGTQVAVTMAYDPKVRLPRDVHAMVVPPSLVGDRFVQLTPAYVSGPTLPDAARLGVERSGVPLELDDTQAGLDKLAVGLGPKGANKDGALSQLLDSSATALDGNGRLYRQTVTELAGALDTLTASSDDVSTTVTNLDRTTRTLAGNDQEVRAVVTALASIGVELNGQRGDIASAVEQLRQALRQLAEFVHGNRGNLDRTIADLTAVTEQIDQHSDQVGELVSLTPVGLSNLVESFVPTNTTTDQMLHIDPAGRSGSLMLRISTFENLDITLGTVLDAMCSQLPAQQKAQLAGLCGALRAAGGDLAPVLHKLTHTSPDDVIRLSPGPTSVPGLLTGGVR